MKRFAIMGLVCAALVLMAGVPGYAQSAARPATVEQEDHQAHHPEGAEVEAAPVPQPAQPAMQQKMMDDMKAMHAQLEARVARMNAATGDAKVEAMAELLSVMVGRHAMMCEGMMRMQGGMMMKPAEAAK